MASLTKKANNLQLQTHVAKSTQKKERHVAKESKRNMIKTYIIKTNGPH